MTTARAGRSAAPPKTRLDREVILAAALELAATGVTSISFRELGSHLGVDPTAVYRHFRSKEELMTALLEEVTAQGLADITAPAAQWRERLRQLAGATLVQYERYPAIGLEAIVITTGGPAEHAAIELILDAFSRAGLGGPELVRHYALLATHIISAAANIARARAERGIEGGGLWLESAPLVDPREYPLVAEYSARLAAVHDTEVYLAGVEMILDSAERTARA